MYVTTMSPDYVSVLLLPEPGLFQESCIEVLPEARATFNGYPLQLEGRGGDQGGLFGQGCSVPVFGLKNAAALPEAREDVISTLELTDGTHTLHMEMKGVGVARTARIVEPPSGPISIGRDVALEWTPASDVLKASEVKVLVQSAVDTRSLKTVTGDAVRIEGNRLWFKMPDLPRGAISITVNPGNSGSVVSCNTSCEHSEGMLTVSAEVR
jgi:hypothetical protein